MPVMLGQEPEAGELWTEVSSGYTADAVSK